MLFLIELDNLALSNKALWIISGFLFLDFNDSFETSREASYSFFSLKAMALKTKRIAVESSSLSIFSVKDSTSSYSPN